MAAAAVQQLDDVLQTASEQVGQPPGALKRHWSNRKCAGERMFPLAKEFLRKVPAVSVAPLPPVMLTISVLGRKRLKDISFEGRHLVLCLGRSNASEPILVVGGPF
jgi:hypothetical protein